MYVQLASTLTIPQASPNAPAVLNPDNLAQVEAGEPSVGTSAQTVLRIASSGFGSYMRTGMGCAGGKCNCGGTCKTGMGIFDSGADFSQWGWPEWLTVAGLSYFVVKLVGDTSRGVSRARRSVRSVSRARARRRKLKEELKATPVWF